MKLLAPFLAVLLAATPVVAPSAPLAAPAAPATPSADHVFADAEAKATKEQKVIFIHFGASWCVWCNRLEQFLARPEIQPVFEKYFVAVKLVVQEDAKNKALGNPGGDVYLKQAGGPDGLPFSAFLDAKGALIVNSKNKGSNIGYPNNPDEIKWFLEMVKKAAPNITPGDLGIIEKVLKSPSTP